MHCDALARTCSWPRVPPADEIRRAPRREQGTAQNSRFCLRRILLPSRARPRSFNCRPLRLFQKERDNAMNFLFRNIGFSEPPPTNEIIAALWPHRKLPIVAGGQGHDPSDIIGSALVLLSCAIPVFVSVAVEVWR